MKKFLMDLSKILADAALLEMGVQVIIPDHPQVDIARPDDCQYGDNDLCFV